MSHNKRNKNAKPYEGIITRTATRNREKPNCNVRSKCAVGTKQFPKTLISLPLQRQYHLVLNHHQDVIAEDQKVRRVDHLRHCVSKLELGAHPMRLDPLTLSAGCLGPLYDIIVFIVMGERARWRAWAFPPCTPRIPFHGDGACTLVLHRGVELRP